MTKRRAPVALPDDYKTFSEVAQKINRSLSWVHATHKANPEALPPVVRVLNCSYFVVPNGDVQKWLAENFDRIARAALQGREAAHVSA